MRKPRWGPVAASVSLVAIVALILVLPTVFGASDQLLRHAQCVAGTPVAAGSFWTPVMILDSPPEYNNSTTYAIGSAWAPGVAPVYMNLSDGEAGGMFSLDRWVLVPWSLRWVSGPGTVPSCPGPTAEDISRSSEGAAANSSFVELLPPGAPSDVSVLGSFNLSDPNGTEYPSVYFIANYTDGFRGLSFRSITENFLDGGGGAWTSESEVGGTFFAVVPFQGLGGRPTPAVTFLSGVESALYVINGPWDGCIQWFNLPNPFGTGLSFGPPPETYASYCTYP